jgi:Flp pilus assembly protein TadB
VAVVPEYSLARAWRHATPLIAAAMLLLTPAGAGATGATGSVTSAATTTAATTSTSTSTASVKQTKAAAGAAAGLAATQSKAAAKKTKQKTKKKTVKKPAPLPLTGWLVNGTTFPNRALVLSGPAHGTLSVSQVKVTENGAPVSPFTLTPTAQSGAGDFGVMLVLDRSASMTSSVLGQAMSAARGVAAIRSPAQQLGLITFDSSPNVQLHLTSDSTAIDTSLGVTPFSGAGANVPAATTLALSQLTQAKLALGVIVVISDGVGVDPSATNPTPQSVQTLAAATHTPIITIGLKDAAATAASLQALAQASPGQFVTVAPAKLASELTTVLHLVTGGYVLRYRSHAAAGAQVSVTARATGMSGAVDVSYQTPSAPKPVVATRHRPAPPSFSHTTLLSSSPSFASSVPAVAAVTSSKSFWTSGAAVPAVAGICGLLIALALALALHRPSKRAVRTRVSNFIPDQPGEDGLGLQLPAASRGGLVKSIQQGRWWPPFVQNVQIARSPHAAGYLVKRAAAIALIIAVLVTLVSGSALIGVIPLIAWPFLLRSLVSRAAEKQRAKFRDTLPGYLQDLASALRVGRSFVGALSVVADSADEPIRGELERALTDEALGRPIDTSLEAVAVRMNSTDMDQVALIAGLNRRSGSNVAEALDRVAEGARERADLRREIKALTGQAKMSSMVLTGLPPILLVGLTLVSPQYSHPLFHTTLGIVLLGVSGVMVISGWKVMQKITRVEA